MSRRGKLRVLLGAAPGVGKTYDMLAEGHRLLGEGKDVVIAIVETHGRSATTRMTEGLPILPRRSVEHLGVVLEEMDLEGALARAPEIALVDELAHTNAPGSRHQKRWQDVEDLLDAGIDVISTLNIQHIESLNAFRDSMCWMFSVEMTSIPASRRSSTSCQRFWCREPGAFVCASSSTSAISGARASAPSRSISSRTTPRCSTLRRGSIGRPSVMRVVALRP